MLLSQHILQTRSNMSTSHCCRLQLATLYVQMGQADDALMVLEAEPNSDNAHTGTVVPDPALQEEAVFPSMYPEEGEGEGGVVKDREVTAPVSC